MKSLILIAAMTIGLLAMPCLADDEPMLDDELGKPENSQDIAVNEVPAPEMAVTESGADPLENVTTRKFTEQDRVKQVTAEGIATASEPSENLYNGSNRKYHSKLKVKKHDRKFANKPMRKSAIKSAKSHNESKSTKPKLMAHWPKSKYVIHKPSKKQKTKHIAHGKKSRLPGSQVCSAND